MAKGRKTGGRRLGSLNKTTIEAKAACAELVDDPAFRRSLARRLHSRKLSPALECMLWYYAKASVVTKCRPMRQRTFFVKWQDSLDERGRSSAQSGEMQ
jgi:hypothetical protein